MCVFLEKSNVAKSERSASHPPQATNLLSGATLAGNPPRATCRPPAPTSSPEEAEQVHQRRPQLPPNLPRANRLFAAHSCKGCKDLEKRVRWEEKSTTDMRRGKRWDKSIAPPPNLLPPFLQYQNQLLL